MGYINRQKAYGDVWKGQSIQYIVISAKKLLEKRFPYPKSNGKSLRLKKPFLVI